MQVRTFAEEVWNGKNYEAVSDLYAKEYLNPFRDRTGGQGRADPLLPRGVLRPAHRGRGADSRRRHGRAQGRLPRDRHRRVRGTGRQDAARLLAQDGRQDEAAALLAEALERYEQAGAGAWAGRVRALLRALGVCPGPRGPRRRPAGGWESLTGTERAVPLLVAEDLANGAVARRLYISPHTVNTHLRHVLAKLGVPGRVAPAAVAHHSIK